MTISVLMSRGKRGSRVNSRMNDLLRVLVVKSRTGVDRQRLRFETRSCPLSLPEGRRRVGSAYLTSERWNPHNGDSYDPGVSRNWVEFRVLKVRRCPFVSSGPK